MTEQSPSRRALIAGAGAAGLTGVLAACGSDDQQPNAGSTTGTAPTTGAPAPPAPAGPLTTKSAIPVGSGVSFGADGVIVAQPTAGKFVGYSNICTHQQCVLTRIQGDRIKCGCHQSEFAIKDGKPLGGPARAPLEKIDLKIEGDNISIA